MAQVSKFNWNFVRAEAGDQEGIDYMYEYINENYKYANQLLYRLEREGIMNETYKKTKTFLTTELHQQKPRFKLSTLTDENVADIAAEMNRFLSTKTSRVGAAKARIAQTQQNIEVMRAAGWNIPTDAEMLSRINDIVGEDPFYYSLDSTFKYQIMDNIEQAFESGMDDEKIRMTFLRWSSAEIKYSEMHEILTGEKGITKYDNVR